MLIRLLIAAAVLLGGIGLAHADPPPAVAPGVNPGVSMQPVAVYDRDGNIVSSFGGATTTTGALQPPTAASGKIVQTVVALSANASTTLVGARAPAGDRLAVEIQCDGLAAVGIDRTGGALTSATAAPLVIPSGAYPLYPMPIATQTAISAFSGTAQTCRVTEYLR